MRINARKALGHVTPDILLISFYFHSNFQIDVNGFY